MAFYWRKFSGTGGSSVGAGVGYSAGSTLNTATLQAVAEEQEGSENLRTLQQHWVQQTVMGVLRWRESSSSNPTSSSSNPATNTGTMTRNNSSSGGGGAVPMNRHSIEVCS